MSDTPNSQESLAERLQRREHHFLNAVEGEYDANLLRAARFEIEAGLSRIERARYQVAKEIAESRSATYLIAPYLRGELDDSVAIVNALLGLPAATHLAPAAPEA